MSLLNVLTSPWAIEQGAFNEVAAQILAHKGQSLPEQEASFAELLKSASRSLAYATRADGVAVLQVSGVMTPRLTWLSALFGGTSTQDLAEQLDAMAADPKVGAALVVWDSPGGSVTGVPAARDAMRRLSAAKPTASLAKGIMASAAYWVGSAARAVYVDGATDAAGSLGVYMRVNWEPASANSMEIVRGKFKRASINGQAPTAEYVAHVEGHADYIYSMLVGDVATHRGVSEETAHNRMGDGRLFLGRQAIDAGLVDRELSIGDAINLLAQKPKEVRRARAAATMGQHSLLHTMDKGAQPLAQAPREPAVPVLEPGALTKVEAVEIIRAHAVKRGFSFIEAASLLDPTGTVIPALPNGVQPGRKVLPRAASPESAALVKEGHQYAEKRGVSFGQALQDLGY